MKGKKNSRRAIKLAAGALFILFALLAVSAPAVAGSVLTVTATETGDASATCDSPTPVTLPVSLDGAGEYCLETSGDITYVNSWNVQSVEINGEDYTNTWSNSMPEKINGNYYIYYAGSYSWSHLEIDGNDSSESETSDLSEEEYQALYDLFSDKYKATYIGRFDFSDSEGPVFSWSTSTIKANFYGTGISMSLKRLNTWHDNALAVVIDDNEYERLNITSDGTFILATGLEIGPHTVEVVKMDEGMSGDIQFLGFEVEAGDMLSPPEPSEKIIEIIGDSISVGYGIESDDPEAAWDANYNNGYLAYGPLAARALGAECVNISWSGTGMYRDYEGNLENVMPIYYWRTLSKDENLLWGFYKPQSDIIVINLHTNDFNPGIPEEDKFVGAYNDFIAKIREKNQKAFIYCAVGPLISGDKLIAARDYIQNGVVEYQKALGDEKIGFLEFSENDPEANGWGAGWHPSKMQHEVMAEELVSRIKSDLGW